MKISNEVLEVFKGCIVKGNNVALPSGQLPRPLYVAVNKVLECLGGKWNKTAKAHIFADDPNEILTLAVTTGEVMDAKKEFQFFETPARVIQKMIELAEIRDDMDILEPSAGKGAIIEGILKYRETCTIYYAELQKENVTHIRETFDEEAICIEFDFVKVAPAQLMIKFDRVIMNPPFTRGQDIAHVEHAYNFLKPGGILVAITSPGWTFRQDNKFADFRNWLTREVKSITIDLPAGTFKESGTMIATKLIVIHK